MHKAQEIIDHYTAYLSKYDSDSRAVKYLKECLVDFTTNGLITDEVGEKIIGTDKGQLEVKDILYKRKRHYYYHCICKCGGYHIANKQNLTSGKVWRCGFCVKYSGRKGKSGNTYKHGLFGNPLFKRYLNIIGRCYNPKSISWKRYGGRGIKVYSGWLDCPENFIRYVETICPEVYTMLESKCQIDRRNNDKGYFPGNIRVVSRKKNTNNRSVTKHINYGGIDFPLSEIKDYVPNLKVNINTIRGRLRKGWSVDDAINTVAWSINKYDRKSK